MVSDSDKLKICSANANDVITIIFVYDVKDIRKPTIKFKPLMTHQIFDEETIYGYIDPKINIYIAAHSGYCYVDIKYDEMVECKQYSLGLDNIVEILTPWFPNNLMLEVKEFKQCIKKVEPDYIFGDCVYCFEANDRSAQKSLFRVVNCNVTDPEFKAFHRRFQTLIIMFIDAANFIDLEDPNWRILYLYNEHITNGVHKNYPVGFCTVYLFKKDTTVARISQFFIVPFLQKQGLGYKMLEATYNYLKASIQDLNEITVESPNKIFTRMRDNLDASYIFQEPQFRKSKLFEGFSDQMLNIARLKYKLSNQQARRIYEILRYYWSKDDPKEYQSFINHLKSNRLTALSKSKYGRHYDEKEFHVYAPILQEEVDKFLSSVVSTIKYLENKFGGTSSRT